MMPQVIPVLIAYVETLNVIVTLTPFLFLIIFFMIIY